MGMISPLETGVEPVWQRLTTGQSGIGLIDRFDTTEEPIKIAGLVPGIEEDAEAGFDIDQVIECKKLDLFTVYALAAAKEALEQANWSAGCHVAHPCAPPFGRPLSCKSAFLPICHCQAGGPGSQTKGQPDQVPWSVRPQQQVPC